jgi:hypothetical protein
MYVQNHMTWVPKTGKGITHMLQKNPNRQHGHLHFTCDGYPGIILLAPEARRSTLRFTPE